MSDNYKNNVDDAGIRLAPVPMQSDGIKMLPAVSQNYIIRPMLQVDEPKDERVPEPSTAADFQPKVKDINKKWKKALRSKNVVVGILMLLLTAAVLVPFILGAAGVSSANGPFTYSYGKFNVFGNIIKTVTISSQENAGREIGAALLEMLPSIVLLVAVSALIVNLAKSFMGIFGAVRPVRYIYASALALISVIAVTIISLVGSNLMNVGKIDFVNDVIVNFATSEEFTLLVTFSGYFILTLLLSVVNPVRRGY